MKLLRYLQEDAVAGEEIGWLLTTLIVTKIILQESRRDKSVSTHVII